MTGRSDDDFGPFVHEVVDGSQLAWTGSRITFDSEGMVTQRRTTVSATRSALELTIEGAISVAGGELSEVRVFGFGYDLRYKDGSRVQFTLAPVSQDWRCRDCGSDTRVLDEYYMVIDDLWAKAVSSEERGIYLCIGCLEHRIGRRLVRTDFSKPSIDGRFSDRLRDRTR